jgi:hypothetical protein
LNSLPEVKRFLKQPGGFDLYEGVTLEWIRGHNPEMTVTGDRAGEQVKYDLSKYGYDELHRLMARLGFEVRAGERAPVEAVDVKAARPGQAISARPDEARSATVAMLPRVAVDTNVVLAHTPATDTPGSIPTLGLREAVTSAIKAGDDLLARGFMADGGRAATQFRVVGGVLCVAAILVLLFCCAGQSRARDPDPQFHSGRDELPRERRRGSVPISSGTGRYTPLPPVPEGLMPGGRASDPAKNV